MQTSWTADINGGIAADLDEFRLEVREVGGMSRFLVLRRTDSGQTSRELLVSGTQSNARSAMAAARDMVVRLQRNALAPLT